MCFQVTQVMNPLVSRTLKMTKKVITRFKEELIVSDIVNEDNAVCVMVVCFFLVAKLNGHYFL